MGLKVTFHSQADCGQNEASGTILSLFVYQMTKPAKDGGLVAHTATELSPMQLHQTLVGPKKWFILFYLNKS